MTKATASDPAPLDLRRPDVRQVALKAFFNITGHWGLSDADRRTLLGQPARSTFYRWKSDLDGNLSRDVLERISYVMGIYKNLRILFTSEAQADGWIKRANTAPPFSGRSALEHMKQGRVMDLADVRRYLESQRAW